MGECLTGERSPILHGRERLSLRGAPATKQSLCSGKDCFAALTMTPQLYSMALPFSWVPLSQSSQSSSRLFVFLLLTCGLSYYSASHLQHDRDCHASAFWSCGQKEDRCLLSLFVGYCDSQRLARATGRYREAAGMRTQLLQHRQELLPRFAAVYRQLRALPRRLRKALQRRWGFRWQVWRCC